MAHSTAGPVVGSRPSFGALVTALAADPGPVDRIGFNPALREPAPRTLALETGSVRLAGFLGLDRHTIVVIGPRSRRLTLLVVPPFADPAVAGSAARNLTTSGILGP